MVTYKKEDKLAISGLTQEAYMSLLGAVQKAQKDDILQLSMESIFS